jgi:hypothetical protein
MIERGKLSMPLFSGFFSEVTKLVMYFIVAVVLGTIAESQKHTRITMVTRVWQELEYCIDVCRVTHGAHIEHL